MRGLLIKALNSIQSTRFLQCFTACQRFKPMFLWLGVLWYVVLGASSLVWADKTNEKSNVDSSTIFEQAIPEHNEVTSDSIKSLQQAMIAHPRNELVKFTLASQYTEVGRYTEARNLLQSIKDSLITQGQPYLWLMTEIEWRLFRSNTLSDQDAFQTKERLIAYLQKINFAKVSLKFARVGADIATYLEQNQLLVAPLIQLAEKDEPQRGQWLLLAASASEETREPIKTRAIVQAAYRWFKKRSLNSPFFSYHQSAQMVEWLARYGSAKQVKELALPLTDFSSGLSPEQTARVINLYTHAIASTQDIQQAKRLVKRLPVNDEYKNSFFHLSPVFFQAHDLDSALYVTSALLSLDSQNVEYQEHMAQILQWQGKYNESLEWWLLLLNEEPTEKRFYQVLSLSDLVDERSIVDLPLEVALMRFDKPRIEISGLKKPQYWMRLADIERAAGHPQAALDLLLAGYREYPEYFPLIRRLLQWMMQDQQYETAMPLFVEYLDHQPEDTLIRYLFAEAALALHRDHLALDQFRLLFMDSDFQLPESSLVVVAELAKRLQESEFERTVLKKLITLAPKKVQYHYRHLLLLRQHPELASDITMEVCIEISLQWQSYWRETHDPGFLILALIAMEHQMDHQGMAALLQEVSTSAISLQGLEHFGSELAVLAHYVEAYDAAERLYRLHTKHPGNNIFKPHIGLMWLYLETQQWEKLEQQLVFTQALERDTKIFDPNARMKLWEAYAVSLHGLKEFQHAIFWYENQLFFYPESRHAQLGLADVLQDMSHWDTAHTVRQHVYHALNKYSDKEQKNILGQHLTPKEKQWLMTERGVLKKSEENLTHPTIEHPVMLRLVRQGRWELAHRWLTLQDPSNFPTDSEFVYKENISLSEMLSLLAIRSEKLIQSQSVVLGNKEQPDIQQVDDLLKQGEGQKALDTVIEKVDGGLNDHERQEWRESLTPIYTRYPRFARVSVSELDHALPSEVRVDESQQTLEFAWHHWDLSFKGFLENRQWSQQQSQLQNDTLNAMFFVGHRSGNCGVDGGLGQHELPYDQFLSLALNVQCEMDYSWMNQWTMNLIRNDSRAPITALNGLANTNRWGVNITGQVIPQWQNQYSLSLDRSLFETEVANELGELLWLELDWQQSLVKASDNIWRQRVQGVLQLSFLNADHQHETATALLPDDYQDIGLGLRLLKGRVRQDYPKYASPRFQWQALYTYRANGGDSYFSVDGEWGTAVFGRDEVSLMVQWSSEEAVVYGKTKSNISVGYTRYFQ